ncbi:MAG TPA: RNA polymerase sigma factor [Terriglobia bacterium]|nr:RNA polymerase sigma factor [Terriglobia bacterium]
MNKQYVAPALPVVVETDPVDRLASLFDAHYDRLYRLARRLAPSADDALDLVQETFLKAARFPKSIPVGESNEEAWLVRVLINIRRDQWRKASVRDRHEKAALGGSRSGSGSRNPEAGLIARTAIWQALNILPPRRRAIVVMYELEELAIPTIASLLGISAITVRWHLSMGRRDLARTLKASIGGTHE